MERRLKLQAIFEGIMKNENVYFQPPPSIRMTYPAIKYSLDDVEQIHADDISYSKKRRYGGILIDEDPDSEYLDEILSLPYCSFDRHYVSDNLHHFSFFIYY